MTLRSSRSARLTRREFARALRLGLGRARIDVRRHGLAGREDLLVAACLRNPTYDPQVDGGIEDWLLAIARDGGATARIRREVIAAAATPIRRRHDRRQIASFLVVWASDGDRVAGRALLRMIDIQVPDDGVAGSAVWGLGAAAWRRIIRSYGRRWDESGRVDWGWIVHVARRKLGLRRLLAVLRSESARDAVLSPLAERAERESQLDAGSDRPEGFVDASLGALERLVGNSGPRGFSALTRWTRTASAADRAEAWRRLLAETDARRIVRRLWAWRWRRPPALHPRLLELAQHPDRAVRRNASHALGRFRDARIRTLALRLLREDPMRAIDGCVLELLERNARDEDAAVVGAVLPRRASSHLRAIWAGDVCSIVETRRSRAWTPVLVRAMDVTPCRHCRGSALRLLADREAVEDSVLREALCDAEPDTRRIARKALAVRRARRRAPRR